MITGEEQAVVLNGIGAMKLLDIASAPATTLFVLLDGGTTATQVEVMGDLDGATRIVLATGGTYVTASDIRGLF